MAEKIIRVCDRCKTEAVLYNTTAWETATFTKPTLGVGEPVKYDLCGKCATAVKVFIIEAAANETETKGEDKDGETANA